MLFAEFLALLGIAFGSGLGVMFISHRYKERKRNHDLMVEDLKKALESGDYRRLDDFLVIHSDVLDRALRKFVEIRRDQLYIDKNP